MPEWEDHAPIAIEDSAEYQATVRPGGKLAQVDATLSVHCPRPGPSTLTLPALDWTIDGSPLLDGKETGLVALVPPRRVATVTAPDRMPAASAAAEGFR